MTKQRRFSTFKYFATEFSIPFVHCQNQHLISEFTLCCFYAPSFLFCILLVLRLNHYVKSFYQF